MSLHRQKIYIAGPDVFRLDWPKIANMVIHACNALHFEALLPIPADQSLDRPNVTGITTMGTPKDAQVIFDSCLNMIRTCDAMVADITPFRGDEPDSGTVFEIATAHALGKPVIAYTRDPRCTDARHPESSETASHAMVCGYGYLIERFGLSCNVMVARACRTVVLGDTFDALFAMKGELHVSGSSGQDVAHCIPCSAGLNVEMMPA